MKILKILPVVVFLVILSSRSSFAMTSGKDTITTSRPSAAAPLKANQAASDASLVIADNGSFYLASDSAKLLADTGQTENTVTIASMSAANVPASNQRTLFLGTTTSATHHLGTAVIVPITSIHTIQFTTAADIPAGGDVYISFPGSANNSASPSATSFAFNNLNGVGGLPSTVVANNITCNSNSYVLSPNIMCQTTAMVPSNTTITIIIGCTAQSSGACTTQAPRMINPTKTASAGTADIWRVNVKLRDSSGTTVSGEDKDLSIGTVESVTVRATIDPSLTFSINGITNGSAWSTSNAGCSAVETTNSGIASTATEVNLGSVSNTPSGTDTKIRNIAGQRIEITTNQVNGYILTATSSSQLINPPTGYFINSNTSPTAFPAGTNYFGIHPCGLDVTTATWNSTASQTCNTYIAGSTNPICLYAWPTSTTPTTLASDTSGPIGVNAVSTGNGITSVAYAVGADAGVPPGEYRAVVTYVATPAF